jgi:hypothetical protein
VYPPPPVFYPGWPTIPPVIVPPVIIPPVEPPCEEGVDEECTPEEPPVDAPEPGLFYLLLMGGLAAWLYRRKTQHTA